MDPLTMVRHRDRALALILEQERDQGMPPRFDWAAWRRSQRGVVARLRSRARQNDRSIHRLGTTLGTGPDAT